MPLTPKLIAVATSAAVLIAGGATAAAVNARPAPEVTAVPAALIETPQTVEVLVWADGAARRVAATEPTVASALAAADITLGEHDRVAPSMGSQLTVGDSVTVSRVTLSQETQQVTLAFGSSQVEDAKLAKGQTKVTTKGVAGLREDVVQTVTVDGQVESTQVLSQNVVREPVHQITAVGTKKPEITSRSAERTPASTSRRMRSVSACSLHTSDKECTSHSTVSRRESSSSRIDCSCSTQQNTMFSKAEQ